MRRYKFWDKQEVLYTPVADHTGKGVWTAEEYIARNAPWAGRPEAKAIISTGDVNCAVFFNYNMTLNSTQQQIDAFKLHYEELGVPYDGPDFTDGMTDEEKLEVIELVEEFRPIEPDIADPILEALDDIGAQLTLANLLAMPDDLD